MTGTVNKTGTIEEGAFNLHSNEKNVYKRSKENKDKPKDGAKLDL